MYEIFWGVRVSVLHFSFERSSDNLNKIWIRLESFDDEIVDELNGYLL